MQPARVVVLGFAAAILVGTAVLMLPISSSSGQWTNPVDALFTATSAVCVTGLVVVDTATYWSAFGQIVIMLLIQLGGLGIMILASVIGLVLVRKLSVRSRMNTVAAARVPGYEDVRGLVWGIVKISLLIEAIVFVVLFLRFVFSYGYSVGAGSWQALFHAVSSFNNAGFSLYSDSLTQYVADPVICLSIAAAVILGGLGFPVFIQLRKEFSKPLHWSMNTKLVLWATVILLVFGTLYITLIEWDNPQTLGALDSPTRVLAGFFQSVQTRTSGFNTVDIGAMHQETWLGMELLMFIGGGPGGTAGGIKVTTIGVLFFIMWTELRGDGAVNIFGKRLSRSVHRQAITVTLLALAAVFVSTVSLMFLTDDTLDQVLFESVSALGTVGLSTGITGDLSPISELLIVALMFVGRLGPLTLGSALVLRERRTLYEYPKERPAIG